MELEVQYEINAFYKFVSLSSTEVRTLHDSLVARGQELGIRGLLLLAEEGINATIAGPVDAMREFRQTLRAYPAFAELTIKTSFSSEQPFRRWKVDVRTEIVTFDGAKLKPGPGTAKKLSPREWHAVLNSEEPVVLIDTRNVYETEIGKFRNAIDPEIKVFSEFSEYVGKSGIPRESKILMYCTGGIRCEKASLEMEKQGYQNVFQLDGGILKYLEEFPSGSFDGECFVFDHRVAVDGNLAPSKQYKLCPHCGNPASTPVECSKCSAEAVVCRRCADRVEGRSCSKNCAEYVRRHPRTQSKTVLSSDRERL